MTRPCRPLSAALLVLVALWLTACDTFGPSKWYRINLEEIPPVQPAFWTSVPDLEWMARTVLEAEHYDCKGVLAVSSARYVDTDYWRACLHPRNGLFVSYKVQNDGIRYHLGSDNGTGIRPFERGDAILRASFEAAGFEYSE